MHPEPQPPPDSPCARIPARTRRQAMDWGLVLASQSIEAVIEEQPETGWALVVSREDYERATAVIDQYRRENLRWPWRQPVSKSGLLFDWGSAAWVLLTIIFFWLSRTRTDLLNNGIMNGAAVAQGEWWRLFTATLLHGDLLHLATNAVFGLMLLGLAMGRFGTGLGLLAAFLAGVGGNVASWLVHGATLRGLGASGVVMGALGLLAAQSFGGWQRNPRTLRLAIVGLAGGMMLFVLLGLNPGTDVIAHLGGFLSGIFLGAILSLLPEISRRKPANLLAGGALAGLVIWTWLLALGK